MKIKEILEAYETFSHHELQARELSLKASQGDQEAALKLLKMGTNPIEEHDLFQIAIKAVKRIRLKSKVAPVNDCLLVQEQMEEKSQVLREISNKAMQGDKEAALDYMRELTPYAKLSSQALRFAMQELQTHELAQTFQNLVEKKPKLK